jgi:uncharacterized membrane protein YdjX (TVP38/TMEM64 family)
MTVSAATTGTTPTFLAVKVAMHRRITARGSGGLLKRLEAGLIEKACSTLLLDRMVPAFPLWLVNLAPAFLDLPLRTCVGANFLGIIAGTAACTWVGVGLGEVVSRGEEPDLGLIFDPMILGPILGLAALAVLPVGISKARVRGVAE